MVQDLSNNPNQPAEQVQRRPTDALWFTVLVASIATGLGMTIFAPVGDDPSPAVTTALPLAPATTMTTTEPSTSPSTAPIP